MEHRKISRAVISRLPRYYRYLGDLLEAGVERISSNDLSKKMQVTASQIRQDLNNFGGFGQQGYGYNVEALFQEISRILGLEHRLKTILIGAGNLGRAIATHMEFETRGFELAAIFDHSPAVIGSLVGGMPVQGMEQLENFCKTEHPLVAVLCIPKDAAQSLADQLIALGIRAFWNFSHYDLAVAHKDIVVENVHMGDSLMTLSYCVHDLLASEGQEQTV